MSDQRQEARTASIAKFQRGLLFDHEVLPLDHLLAYTFIAQTIDRLAASVIEVIEFVCFVACFA